MGNEPMKINRIVRQVLEDNPGQAFTMGDLMRKADISKTMANDVSSALYKLRGSGLVKAARGPSTSEKGPRFVRTYQWVVRVQVKDKRASTAVLGPLAGLGMFRI